MESKIGVLASGIAIGMLVLVSCEPLYQKLTKMKDNCSQKMSKVKTDAQTSLADVKEKVKLKTDDTLDTITEKVNDLITSLDNIDISKVKGKSKMFLEDIKQKLTTLKQN